MLAGSTTHQDADPSVSHQFSRRVGQEVTGRSSHPSSETELACSTFISRLSDVTAPEDETTQLQLLTMGHSERLEQFERDNREFFASRIGDRGDEFFTHFAEQLAARDEENETGRSLFFVLVTGTGQIIGRVNITDIDQPPLTELGFRVAGARQGRGVATPGVRAALAVAHDRGVASIMARAAVDNVGSRWVLERTGFAEIGPVEAPPAADGSFMGYRDDLSGREGTPALP